MEHPGIDCIISETKEHRKRRRNEEREEKCVYVCVREGARERDERSREVRNSKIPRGVEGLCALSSLFISLHLFEMVCVCVYMFLWCLCTPLCLYVGVYMCAGVV